MNPGARALARFKMTHTRIIPRVLAVFQLKRRKRRAPKLSFGVGET